MICFDKSKRKPTYFPGNMSVFHWKKKKITKNSIDKN